jgi:hypothetical protein
MATFLNTGLSSGCVANYTIQATGRGTDCVCDVDAQCASGHCSSFDTCLAPGTKDCFPSTATALLESGEKVSMRDPKVGQKVLAAPGIYSEVYMFTHRLADAKARVVAITTPTTTLRLSPGHYLYINGSLAVAERARVGDMVLGGSGETMPVLAVAREWADGLYNPHTLHGDIVVDGVRASTYTQSISPGLAHSALYPVRLLYQAGIDITAGLFDNGFDALASARRSTEGRLLSH